MIKELLAEEGQQDKTENLTTTSLKFKKDLWKFFRKKKFKSKVACEFGTHKGQTTKILSHLFRKVYTVNLPGHMSDATRFNADRDNITFIEQDLYAKGSLGIAETICTFFVDAVHTYNAVMADVDRIREMNLDDEVFLVFDDYGLIMDVNIAIKDLVETGEIEIITTIGHTPGHDFGNGRILKDWEGVIAKLKK